MPLIFDINKDKRYCREGGVMKTNCMRFQKCIMSFLDAEKV